MGRRQLLGSREASRTAGLDINHQLIVVVAHHDAEPLAFVAAFAAAVSVVAAALDAIAGAQAGDREGMFAPRRIEELADALRRGEDLRRPLLRLSRQYR